MTLLVVVGLGYFLVYRPIQGFLAGFGTPAQTTASQTTTSQTSTTQTTANGQPAPVTPQAALTTGDVQRFVRVRRSVRAAMGQSFVSVEKVFTDIQNGQSPNVMTVLGVLRDATSSVGRARTAQQAALESQGMNLTRYSYVRGEVNKALGVPDIDFRRAADAITRGQLPDLNTTVRAPDAKNAALITPFKKELTVTAPLGLLGL
jgi:hypothetical protein